MTNYVYGFYSENQREIISKQREIISYEKKYSIENTHLGNKSGLIKYETKDGNVVYVTEVSKTPYPSSSWNDYEYVGIVDTDSYGKFDYNTNN